MSFPTVTALSFDCKQGAVRSVKFNGDGNYCLTTGSDKTIKLWNPHRGILVKTYSGHGYEVLDAVASHDNSNLASCGMDKCVNLWDVATGNIIRKFRGHAGHVHCVKFNEESSVVVSASKDNTVKIWDCRSRNKAPIQTLDEAKDCVQSIDISDHEILTGSLDGRVRRYDLRSGDLDVDYIAHPVTCVSFTGDGQCMLVSSLDAIIRLMDKETGELLNEYIGHTNSEYKIESCLSNTDAHVLSGSEDGKIFIWNLVEGKITHIIEGAGKGVVHSISYHPSECKMISACEGTIRIWVPEYTVT